MSDSKSTFHFHIFLFFYYDDIHLLRKVCIFKHQADILYAFCFRYIKDNMSSTKSSSLTSVSSRSSPSISNPLSSLPKIRRIQRETTPSLSSAPATNTHPNIIITKNDALRIFHGLTILFIGDPFLRTLFRDLVKLISTGHLLDQSEAAIQNGEYQPNQGTISYSCTLQVDDHSLFTFLHLLFAIEVVKKQHCL
jgi:hypothetical protein